MVSFTAYPLSEGVEDGDGGSKVGEPGPMLLRAKRGACVVNENDGYCRSHRRQRPLGRIAPPHSITALDC